MKATPELLAAIEQARAEGRITEGKTAVVPGIPTTAPRMISEKEFMQAVIDLARQCGWMVYHTYRSNRSEPGYPDLTMVLDRNDAAGFPFRIFWVELKTQDGTLTAPQQTWIEAIRAAGGECYLWRPSDWPQIVEVLNGGRKST